jgi:hypothetical protein
VPWAEVADVDNGALSLTQGSRPPTGPIPELDPDLAIARAPLVEQAGASALAGDRPPAEHGPESEDVAA